MVYPSPPERNQALDRMVHALEAAKRARDAGMDVHQVRELLKQSRAAFEAGDYPSAMRIADEVIQEFGKVPAAVHGGLDRSSVLARMRDALESMKRAKRSGMDVRRARELLKQAKDAYKAGNYAAAMERASETIALCGGVPR